MDLFVLLIVALCIVALAVFFYFVPFLLWISALVSGVHISLVQLFLMRIRKVPPQIIVRAMIEAHKAGLKSITRDELEAHYLAGGRVERVVHALVSAAKANIDLGFQMATAIDLAGRDVFEAVQMSVNPKVIDTPPVVAVAKDGISFAFVRVGNRGLTTGKLSQDDYFEYNAKAADQAGLKVGAYFFSQATTEEEAREEADFVIERLQGRNITYPVAYDHERLADTSGRADDLSPEQMTKNAAAFCARIQEAGYTPMIYGSMKDLLRYNLPDLAHYNIWLAQYNVNAPTFNQYFSIWQYSNTGSVSGIDGNVDLNIQFLTEEK